MRMQWTGERGKGDMSPTSPPLLEKSSWDLCDSKSAANWGRWNIIGEIQRVRPCVSHLWNSSIKEASQRPLQGVQCNTTHVWGVRVLQGYLILHWCLQRIYKQNAVKKEKKKTDFIGFPCTKETDLNLQWHHVPGADETYHGNDNQPDDSTKILECLVSLISTVHSSLGILTLSLNVFLFLLFFISMSTECIV